MWCIIKTTREKIRTSPNRQKLTPKKQWKKRDITPPRCLGICIQQVHAHHIGSKFCSRSKDWERIKQVRFLPSWGWHSSERHHYNYENISMRWSQTEMSVMKTENWSGLMRGWGQGKEEHLWEETWNISKIQPWGNRRAPASRQREYYVQRPWGKHSLGRYQQKAKGMQSNGMQRMCWV